MPAEIRHAVSICSKEKIGEIKWSMHFKADFENLKIASRTENSSTGFE